MKKALIKDTKICQVTDTEFPVHKNLLWVDVPDGTTELDTYVNGSVVKYVQQTVPVIDQSDLDKINLQLKAIALMVGRWNGKTATQIKADFRQAWQDVQ